MSEYNEALAVEKFIKEFSSEFYQIKKFVKFLNIMSDENIKTSVDESLKIIEKKLKKIKKAEDFKELNKHLKIKSVVKVYEKRN